MTSNTYIILALFFCIGQFIFLFLANRQGRKEAHTELENNLTKVYNELDENSKKEFLLNAKLNKEDIIFLVNNQTKNSAVDIISTTIREFQIIQKDLDTKGKYIEAIDFTTKEMAKNQKLKDNTISPIDLSINSLITVDNQVNTPRFLRQLGNKDDNFKIWITFTQGNVEIHTYLKSMGNWEIDTSMDNPNNTIYPNRPYLVFVSVNSLVVSKGSLNIEKSNSTKLLRTDREINFKVHYTKSTLDLYFDKINFITKNGRVIQPYDIKTDRETLIDDIFLDPTGSTIENQVVLSGKLKL